MSDQGQPEKQVWEPPADWWIVKTLRFANLLDDARNILSPVKVNVWAANLAAVSTAFAGIFVWLSGHIGSIEGIGTLVGGWLTHAHTVHHFDKRERNKQEARMKGPE